MATKAFERTQIASIQNKSTNTSIYNNFKAPCLLDFLGLQNACLEKDLETAILKEVENFIAELGKGICICRTPKAYDTGRPGFIP
jgi:predicted nuclease of restriction endonuclease-like (RecB) superfamily